MTNPGGVCSHPTGHHMLLVLQGSHHRGSRVLHTSLTGNESRKHPKPIICTVTSTPQGSQGLVTTSYHVPGHFLRKCWCCARLCWCWGKNFEIDDRSVVTCPNKNGDFQQTFPYASALGSLLYVRLTRPDILVALNILTRFMKDPHQHHWDEIKDQRPFQISQGHS